MYLQYVTCTSRAVLQLCGYDNANEFHLVFPLLEPQTGSTVGDWRGWRDFDFSVMWGGGRKQPRLIYQTVKG